MGVAGVVYWRLTGDLSLYLTLQFGGMVALMVLLVTTRRGNDPFPWWWLIGWYLFAEVLEVGDVAIYHATHGAVAGHTLKHLAAAIGGAGLLLPLRAAMIAPVRAPITADAASGRAI